MWWIHRGRKCRLVFCQIGKALTGNEVTPRNFTFTLAGVRTKMELEFFAQAGLKPIRICLREDQLVERKVPISTDRLTEDWGWDNMAPLLVSRSRRLLQQHRSRAPPCSPTAGRPKLELAHCARACVDILFKFPFGAGELEGIAARRRFDLAVTPEGTVEEAARCISTRSSEALVYQAGRHFRSRRRLSLMLQEHWIGRAKGS